LRKILSSLRGIFNKRSNAYSNNVLTKNLTPEKFKRLEKLIGTDIHDKSYFVEALVHRSYLEENDVHQISNERLEFLGDSVLNMVIGEYLFREYPGEEEGFLTKVRAKLVNRSALNIAAENIRLGDFILFSSNVPKTIIAGSKSILSDALEALIGAIYLDRGIGPSKKFIKRIIVDPLMEDGELLVDENYKSQLLEYAQANKLNIPAYRVIDEEGPHHDKTFTVEVSIGEVTYGTGVGKNKKTAEQKAAFIALQRLTEIKNL